jgi:predicted DNA-binding protein (UPF0251 family)
VATGGIDEAALAEKFSVMRPFLDERGWRVYLGTEARALGYGGVAAVARASGASPDTVAAGAAEAGDPGALAALPPGASRRPGAGRPEAGKKLPGLKAELDGLLEEGRRGDPMSAVTWNVLSLRDIARQLSLRGFPVGKDAVAKLMHADGYSLQGMAKVLEGSQHEDRDLQFGNINAAIAAAAEDGQPALSVDGKKKEQLGPYHREGASWRRKGDPVKVRDHDFPERGAVTAVPYGIYDIAANRGFVSVGTSGDTAAFAVNAIRLWWREEGSLRYPGATRLLLACDAGGANDYRSHLWKDQLAVLAAETGLRVEVRHFPSGTSKWNKIEHRLFCHVTRTWRARPLMTLDDVAAGVAATVTSQGLKCTAVRDDAAYPTGLKVSGERRKYLEGRVTERDAFHGERNYAILPAPRPAPAPEPEPAPPGRVPRDVLNHPALTGIPAADLDELTERLQAPFAARLQLDRRLRAGPRTSAIRSTAPHGCRKPGIADHLAALRLRDHLGLPHQAIAALLGVDTSAIGRAITLARELLDAARITLPAGPPPDSRPRTPRELLALAAGAGIPLTIPENNQTMPDHFKPRRSSPRATRTEPPTK